MRTSTASLAVIRRPGADGSPSYLAQWNEKWKAFNLVGGHKRDSESHRACLVRELAEELGIVPGPDDPDAAAAGQQPGPLCHIAREPLGRLEYEGYSQSAGERSFYRIELFAVGLSPAALAHVERDRANRWLAEAEIEAGRCGDGKAVSDTLRQHWGWLRRHEPMPAAVYWLRAAQQRLCEALGEQQPGGAALARECDQVARQLRQLFPQARAIIVRNRLPDKALARSHELTVEVIGPGKGPARVVLPATNLCCLRQTHRVQVGGHERAPGA